MFSFVLFLLRVPRWELQIRREQQTKKGEDGVHQRADSRTGGRVRPSQLLDQTEALRNRREPGSHGKTGETTTSYRTCSSIILSGFNFGLGAFLSSCGRGLLYSRCFKKLSLWLSQSRNGERQRKFCPLRRFRLLRLTNWSVRGKALPTDIREINST